MPAPTAPKRPAPGGSSPPAPVATASAKEPVASGLLAPAVPHQRRLQLALGKIDTDTATPSTARSVVGSYFRFLNPTQTTEHLPRALHPHPSNPEASRDGKSIWDVLCFYLGSAAKAIQDAYRIDREFAKVSDTKIDAKLAAKAQAEAAIAILEARTARLETLAGWGPAEWVVKGTDATGFSLITKDEAKTLLTAEVEAAKIHLNVGTR